jgi:lipoate-protein ligase A
MLHGEYKEPGGKLIQVDFDLVGGRLNHVQVSGDFFLYPEEALEGIVAAVEGTSADLSELNRAHLISAAIGPETEWLGASPQGLAIAIARALATRESA